MTVRGARDVIDGAVLLRWARTCVEDLASRRPEINALNVFPIADADTGTNLLATMRAALDAAEAVAGALPAPGAGVGHDAATRTSPSVGGASVSGSSPTDAEGREHTTGAGPSAGAVAAALARGATAGARGNSGIILTQVLRGIAEAVREGPLTADTLRLALRRGALLVRGSLSVPVEGTMLTVLDCAAQCAAECPENSLAEVAIAAADGAAKALADTTAQLGVLREAGVVDAGARGLLVLLDALVGLATGEAPARPAYPPADQRTPPVDTEPRPHAVEARGDSDAQGVVVVVPDDPHFEVMYLLTGTDEERVAQLRVRLSELGDSVVVVGDGAGTWSAHVHCVDAGAAVEAGLATGALSSIRIESFAVTAHGPDCRAEATAGPVDRGILAVAFGPGAAALFQAAGAVVLDEGPVTARSLLAAIRRMPHREVMVLPNGALPAHELVAVGVAARDAHRDVLLLPSGSMVQGLAAAAVHDRGRIAVDDAFAMSEAAAATRWGSLRAARERALTMVGTCAAGDGLGLVGHDVVVIDHDVRAAGRTLLDRMLGLGGELVTLLMGADAPEDLAEELAAHIGRGFPGVEVTVYPGGQHDDLVQIGVE
ncbi:DAK2 domain-containing protein [Nocardia sp. NPDC048505]|uniref:DAK2 domain-containing protein n=1 Tax=unclassified Nocardia TaxID=2637762 RepID=UPI0033F9B2C6